jgi:Probable cobalt transporter subunit (CbtA)
MASYLRRSMVAGLLAGLLAGLFTFVMWELPLDQAIGLEESNYQEGQALATHGYESDGDTPADGGETFSRSVQKVSLFFATGLFSTVVGGLFVALPAATNPGAFPTGGLWSFRLSSLGTQLVLWTGSGVGFGLLLCEGANRGELH